MKFVWLSPRQVQFFSEARICHSTVTNILDMTSGDHVRYNLSCRWQMGHSQIEVSEARLDRVGLPGVGRGGTPILGQYGYVPPPPPTAPHFWPWQLKDPPFEKKNTLEYVSWLFLAPKPFFHMLASSESPPFSV